MSPPSQPDVEHGFPNLRLIHRSISDLHKRFPGNELLGLRFPAALSPAIIQAATTGDPLISTQRIAGAIVHHYHLPLASIVVRFDSKMKMESAGRIQVTSDDICVVDLQERFRSSDETVAILAHEIAHLFLERVGLRYADEFENEVLTDTTSVYLGAGWSSINSYVAPRVKQTRESVGYNRVRVTTTSTPAAKLGYLTPEEFGYILARRCQITKESVSPWLTRPEGRAAFRKGARRVRRERSAPPLVQAGFLRRVCYRGAVLLARRGSEAEPRVTRHQDYSIEAAAKKFVVFHCPLCTKQLRMPIGIASATVRCGVCNESFECAS